MDFSALFRLFGPWKMSFLLWNFRNLVISATWSVGTNVDHIAGTDCISTISPGKPGAAEIEADWQRNAMALYHRPEHYCYVRTSSKWRANSCVKLTRVRSARLIPPRTRALADEAPNYVIIAMWSVVFNLPKWSSIESKQKVLLLDLAMAAWKSMVRSLPFMTLAKFFHFFHPLLVHIYHATSLG